jgi:hypothetical protein
MVELELTIDDEVTKCNIPESWADVTVGDYMEISKLDNTGKTDIELLVSILTILLGIEDELIYMLPVAEFNRVAAYLKFTNEKIETSNVDYIELDGEKYFLKKDFEQLTMGETVSIELLLEKNDNKVETAMNQLLCIFLRKKKENGKLETFKNSFMERAEQFKKISIIDVHNLFLFFSIGSE